MNGDMEINPEVENDDMEEAEAADESVVLDLEEAEEWLRGEDEIAEDMLGVVAGREKFTW